jgi:hypothetical protein
MKKAKQKLSKAGGKERKIELNMLLSHLTQVPSLSMWPYLLLLLFRIRVVRFSLAFCWSFLWLRLRLSV